MRKVDELAREGFSTEFTGPEPYEWCEKTPKGRLKKKKTKEFWDQKPDLRHSNDVVIKLFSIEKTFKAKQRQKIKAISPSQE